MKIAIDVAALGEFREARRWYNERAPGLGDELIAAVDEVVKRAASKPLMFPAVRRHPRARRASLDRFPYIVVFTLHEDTFIIVALSHGKQRPGYWAKRLGPLKAR